jgi:hypothetical protein
MYRGKKKLTEEERAQRDAVRKRLKEQRRLTNSSRFKEGCPRAQEAGRRGGLARAVNAGEGALDAPQEPS